MRGLGAGPDCNPQALLWECMWGAGQALPDAAPCPLHSLPHIAPKLSYTLQQTNETHRCRLVALRASGMCGCSL